MRVAAAVAAVGLTGCFYIDPIETRPGVLVHLSGDVVNGTMTPRNGHVTATATFDDPKLHGVFSWQAIACGPAGPGHVEPDAELCDDLIPPEPKTGLDAMDSARVTYTVPVITATHGQLVDQVLIKLDAHDDHGVLTPGEESLTVIDGPPTLSLRTAARSLTAGAPIDVFAEFGDPEIAYEGFDPDQQITWQVTPDAELSDLDVPPPVVPDMQHITVGKRLVPPTAGTYTVTVTASDPKGDMTMPPPQQLQIAPDQPPCLAQWQPIIPPDGQTVPVTAPTLFQVPLVTDDLDAYPRISDDDAYGTAAFAWSILRPGETQRTPLSDATGNRASLDPSAFAPGDIVELRVEVFDRSHAAPLSCADGAATCAIGSDPRCLQRQTWRVEVR